MRHAEVPPSFMMLSTLLAVKSTVDSVSLARTASEPSGSANRPGASCLRWKVVWHQDLTLIFQFGEGRGHDSLTWSRPEISHRRTMSAPSPLLDQSISHYRLIERS